MDKGELSYHHAYERGEGEICPETGKDLSQWSAESVRAHTQDLYPDYALADMGSTAKERREILLEIAKKKER